MSTATTMRDTYLAAEVAILAGQSFELAGRKLTRADLASVVKGRKEWEQRCVDEVAAAAGRSGGMRYSVADFTGRQ